MSGGSPVKKAITVVIALALLAGASMIVPVLNDMRRDAKLTFEEPLKGVPPILVITTTALGCFRGIIANLLWLRATKLKEEGKYFEHMQLSDWICKLEPRFPMVWAHRAWDMAYNISVQLPTAEERWKWVSKGIELLRDEGLKYNPSAPMIYKELAWIFFHKIGNNLDDMHWYYKEQLYRNMEDILGGPEPDLEALAAAPRTKGVLLEDPAVALLAKRFIELGVDLPDRYFALAAGRDNVPAPAGELFGEVMEDPAMKKVEMFARAARLRSELKMEPEKMIALMDEYGPLDWRHAASHSLYWVKQGLQFAPEKESINYDRIAYFSIQSILRTGRLQLIEQDGKTMLLSSSDYRFTGPMERLFLKVTAHYEEKGSNVTGIKGAYGYFLEDVIWVSFFSGDTKKAAEFYRKRFPDRTFSPRILRDYVNSQVSEQVKNASRYDAVRTVEILIARMWHAYATENDDQAVFYENRAATIHRIYSKDQSGADERMGLAPMKTMKEDVLRQILEKKFLLQPFPAIILRTLELRLNRKSKQETDKG